MTASLRQAIESGEFVVTVEMNLFRCLDAAALDAELAAMEAIYATGRVHAISVTDNPGGNPTALADDVSRRLAAAGIEPLTHFSAKDRSRNHATGQLFALDAAGLPNVLFMTGDCQASGWRGTAKPVFDLDSVQLQQLATQMNTGVELPVGGTLAAQPPTSLFAGCCVTPYKYRTGEIIPQYLKMEKKVAAGARFLITQLGYDTRKLHELMLYLRERGLDTPVIANVYLLTRVGARMMREGKIAGCVVSDALAEQLEAEASAVDKGRSARIDRAAKQVAIARGLGCAGVHIGGPRMTAELVEAVLDRAAELESEWRACAAELSYGLPDGAYLYPPDPSNPGLNAQAPATMPPEDIAGRKLFDRYRLSRAFHWLLFTPGKRLSRVFFNGHKRKEARHGLQHAHGIEHAGKALIYGCKDCGDCGLEACAYSCPMASCPKGQRNGPCGGSFDGWCEKYPGERYCIWYKAYHRLSRYGGLERLGSFTTPPNDWSFEGTSAWSNYAQGRDNIAKREPGSFGL